MDVLQQTRSTVQAALFRHTFDCLTGVISWPINNVRIPFVQRNTYLGQGNVHQVKGKSLATVRIYVRDFSS